MLPQRCDEDGSSFFALDVTGMQIHGCWEREPALILTFSPREKERVFRRPVFRWTFARIQLLVFPRARQLLLPLLEERAGVRTVVLPFESLPQFYDRP
jgi:hypothetical protein